MKYISLLFILFFILSCDLTTPNENINEKKGFYNLKEYWAIEEIKGDTISFVKSCDVCVIHIIPELGFNVILGFDDKNLHGLFREFHNETETFPLSTYFSTKVVHHSPRHLQTKDLVYRLKTNRFEFIRKTESNLLMKKLKYKPQ